MRRCTLLTAVASALSVAGPAAAAAVTPAEGFWDAAGPQLPSATPERSWTTRVRDGAIRWIWGPPPQAASHHGTVPPTAMRPLTPVDPRTQYGNDVVIRFNISSAAEAQALAEASDDLFLDVWEQNSAWADVRLARDTVPILLSQLPDSLQHAHAPLMHDLAQAVAETLPARSAAEAPLRRSHARGFSHEVHAGGAAEPDNLFFEHYQPLSVIHPWMRLLRSLFPAHVQLISLGVSAEGRDILAFRVGVRPAAAGARAKPRPTILVSGGSHAREWISTSSVAYAAYALITGYGRGREATQLVEAYDWVFVPTLNPDGYVYSWDSDRLWRKNRQRTSLRFCTGLDVDRSFSFQWDGARTRGNPCSEAYAGEAPLEAVEARRLAAWVDDETAAGRARVVAFLDLHSYAQQVLYPFAYSCIATPPTLETLEELGLGLAKVIRLADGRAYDVTSACEGGVASADASGGSALDYLYHAAGVRFAYQIKLRDRGSYGFLLPRKHIVPSGREAYAAVLYLGQFLQSGPRAADEDAAAALVATEAESAANSTGDAAGAELRADSSEKACHESSAESDDTCRRAAGAYRATADESESDEL